MTEQRTMSALAMSMLNKILSFFSLPSFGVSFSDSGRGGGDPSMGMAWRKTRSLSLVQ